MNEIIKLAVDCYKGSELGKYSTSDANEVLRAALIEANGGETSINYRAVRDGRCSKLFAIMEEIITKTVIEGLPDSCKIFDFVEFRNKALGDQDAFIVEDGGLFAVADTAEGTQGVRRQRLVGGETVYITPVLKTVKFYDELNRFLAGRIDLNKLVDKVSKSFIAKINQDIADAFIGTYAKLASPYTASGSFSAATLVTLIDHVEAANGGKTAYILGSKQAVRKITSITGADAVSAKEDLYNGGYFGHVGNNPVIAMDNAHKVGATTFVLNDTDLFIVCGDDKFIKVVTEGDTLILPGNPTDNADLSQDFMVAQRTGTAILMSEAFGMYRMS